MRGNKPYSTRLTDTLKTTTLCLTRLRRRDVIRLREGEERRVFPRKIHGGRGGVKTNNMETAFKNINIDSYLENKRARTAQKETLSGLKFTNQRQEVVQGFVDRLNKEREGTKYKPLTWTHVNGQLRFYKEMTDLRILYKQCDEARCFSSLFWWKLKQV